MNCRIGPALLALCALGLPAARQASPRNVWTIGICTGPAPFQLANATI